MKAVSLLFWYCSVNPVGLSHSILFFLLLGHCASEPLSGVYTFISLLVQFCCLVVVSVLFLERFCSCTSICLLFLLAFLMFLNCLYSFYCGLMSFLEMAFSILQTFHLSVTFELVTVCFQRLFLWLFLIFMIKFWCLHFEEVGSSWFPFLLL